MKEQLANWLSTLVRDARQGVVGYLAVIAVIAISSGLIVLGLFIRSTIHDFLTAELRVWHLLLTLGVIVALVALALVIRRTRRQSRGEVPGRALSYPTSVFRRTMEWGGVKWRLPGGDDVDGPFCPTDETFLARYQGDSRPPEVRRPESDAWVDVHFGQLNFVCLKCNKTFDLRGHGNFKNITNILLSLAQEPERAPKV